MTRRPLVAAGALLGIGVGGLGNGILFRQILQVHNTLSARLPPRVTAQHVEMNVFWDGVSFALSLAVTAAGVWLLWRVAQREDVPRSGRTLAGALLLGWGICNLGGGFIDQHLLHTHHLLEKPDHLPWDVAFLLSGALFILLGLKGIGSGRGDFLVHVPSRDS